MRDCDGWLCSAARMWLSPLSLQRCRDRIRGSGICLPGPRFAPPNRVMRGLAAPLSLVTCPSVKLIPAPALAAPPRNDGFACTWQGGRVCTRCAALQS